MNPVLLLTRNNLALTKRCIESIRKQDIPTRIYVFDNGSTDGTREWLDASMDAQLGGDLGWAGPLENVGVSAGWNEGLNYLFYHLDSDYVLCPGNDTILAPWTYSSMLSCNVGFVTGSDVGMSPLPEAPTIQPLSPHPDFSLFLLKREVWQKVGPFNTDMRCYVQDCDFHVRAHRLGISLLKANIPYNHERSSTMRLAPPEERDAIAAQAGEDRKVFQSIYGCIPGQPGYENLFK
jgi:GT2 family glycosyltransferase